VLIGFIVFIELPVEIRFAKPFQEVGSKVIGSRFRIQAPLVRRDVDMKLFSLSMNWAFNQHILTGHVWARDSRLHKMLISVTLYSMVWIGRFHPLGETWNSTRWASVDGVLKET